MNQLLNNFYERKDKYFELLIIFIILPIFSIVTGQEPINNFISMYIISIFYWYFLYRNKVKIFKKKNYFEDFIISKIKKKNKNSNNILYILEPFDGKFEFLALDKFKEHLKKFRGKMNIKLKLHPSESKNKYKNWLKKNNSIGFSLVDEFDLSKSLSWADYVVGLESYMLVLAMKAKKKVFTLLPLNKKKFRLPFVKIQNIDKFKIL